MANTIILCIDYLSTANIVADLRNRLDLFSWQIYFNETLLLRIAQSSNFKSINIRDMCLRIFNCVHVPIRINIRIQFSLQLYHLHWQSHLHSYLCVYLNVCLYSSAFVLFIIYFVNS